MTEPGFTIWLTGLPRSGKTTIARLLADELSGRGFEVETLDGSALRTDFSKDLGFSKEDRETHVKRAGYMAKLLAKHGVITIATFVSPYRETRDMIREDIIRFVEVFVKVSAEECAKRDTKGLYKKAQNGEIEQFTGVSSPYEEPLKPEVLIETDKELPEEAVGKIVMTIEKLGFLTSSSDTRKAYSAEEEKEVENRLKDLGYL